MANVCLHMVRGVGREGMWLLYVFIAVVWSGGDGGNLRRLNMV